MTDNTQPEALRLADALHAAVQTYPQASEDEPGGYCTEQDQLMDAAATELCVQHTRIAELEAQLEAIGAGGVQEDKDLQRRCVECVEWQQTGELREGALRAYAKKHWPWHHDSLQMAERATETQAMRAVASWGTHHAPPAEQQAAPKAAPGEPGYRENWDAELGRTAMRFVDRAGDVHPGIDDAETICAEFYKAMSEVIERMPHVQRMAAPQQEAQEPTEVPYQKLTNEIDLILSDPDTELSIGAKRALLWMRTWVSVPLFTAPQQEAQGPWGYARKMPGCGWGFCSKRQYEEAVADGDETKKLYATPQPAPAPLSEMPYETRKAIQEGEQIGASDAWFKARHEMLDTVDRRNVFRAGFDRGWSAALAAQGDTP